MAQKDKRKPETIIRELRRNEKYERETRARVQIERDEFRARATKAEQKAAEWERRFDALLAKPWAKVDEGQTT